MRSPLIALLGSCLVTAISAQPPVITPGRVQNAAAITEGSTIAPGSLISIFGNQLASTLAVADSLTLSTRLGDVDSVTINGLPAPLQFVSATQINAQTPWGVIPGQANVVVTRGGVASQPVAAQVTTYSPNIYFFNQGAAPPRALAIAVNSDGTITHPAGAIPGVGSHPARAGDSIFFYASGLGPLDQPPPADGFNSIDRLRNTNTPLTVLVGGVNANVQFAGLAPEFAGVYQVNIEIPGGVTGDAVPLRLMIGGASTRDGDQIHIAIQ
jgi:uncharacterized protein (TIGR03437 family)